MTIPTITNATMEAIRGKFFKVGIFETLYVPSQQNRAVSLTLFRGQLIEVRGAS